MKYWDIIPRKKQTIAPNSIRIKDFEKFIKELEKSKIGKSDDWTKVPYQFPGRVITVPAQRPCLHDHPGCYPGHVHMLSCPCPRCTPTFSVGDHMAAMRFVGAF